LQSLDLCFTLCQPRLELVRIVGLAHIIHHCTLRKSMTV
jgi:hypothetical protein